MRRAITAALLLALVASRPGASPADDPPPAAPATEAERAATAVEMAKAEAARYRIELVDEPARPVALRPDALLQWSNPVAGSIHGSVFVWTDRGCPVVVTSIFKWFSPNSTLCVELHTLTPGPVTADRQGRRVWSPGRADLGRKPIPEAPTPADSPAGRLRQLRALATEFSASETTREGIARELRLLNRPLYRYESADPEVIDGGLFAFVQGTDPEVFLMIEARKSPEGPRWEFAAARMNSIDLRLNHRGRPAWSVPVIPWSQARDHNQPYSLFVYGSDPGNPGDGPAP